MSNKSGPCDADACANNAKAINNAEMYQERMPSIVNFNRPRLMLAPGTSNAAASLHYITISGRSLSLCLVRIHTGYKGLHHTNKLNNNLNCSMLLYYNKLLSYPQELHLPKHDTVG